MATQGTIWQRLSDKLLFFGYFFRNPLSLSTPMESNRKIVSTVYDELVACQPRRVIELGAGVGTMTQAILQTLPEDGQLFCIEKHASFCNRLKKRVDNRTTVRQDEGQNVPALIKGTEFENPDAVVCSIPLTIPGARDVVGAVASIISPDTPYIQLTINPEPMYEYFELLRSYRFMSNIPPEKLHVARLKTSGGGAAESEGSTFG